MDAPSGSETPLILCSETGKKNLSKLVRLGGGLSFERARVVGYDIKN